MLFNFNFEFDNEEVEEMVAELCENENVEMDFGKMAILSEYIEKHKDDIVTHFKANLHNEIEEIVTEAFYQTGLDKMEI